MLDRPNRCATAQDISGAIIGILKGHYAEPPMEEGMGCLAGREKHTNLPGFEFLLTTDIAFLALS